MTTDSAAPVRSIEVRQPAEISFIGRFQAAFWAAALLYFIYYTLTNGGIQRQDLPLLALIVGFNIVAWTQLLVRVRKLIVSNDGVRLFFYVGRSTSLGWNDFSALDVIDAGPGLSGKGAKKVIQLKRARGRTIKLDDRMSNFAEAMRVLVVAIPQSDQPQRGA
jgi:hypothetical protein